MRFKHLNLPQHWETYFDKYPQGYTILEALMQWVQQVDKMVDNQNDLNRNVNGFRNELDIFLKDFSPQLQKRVAATLSEWQASGFLEVIITEAMHTQIDEIDDRLTADMTDTKTKVSTLSTRHIALSNSDGAVTHALNVGGTYLGRQNIIYGNDYTPFSDLKGTVNGKFELDCSSFIQAIVTGTTYENSSYFAEQNTHGMASYPLVNDARKRGRMLAHQIAKHCYDNGYSYIPKADWSNVEVGDLVFNSNSGEEGFWNDIGHLGMVSRKDQNGDITILQCIETSPSPIVETKYTTAQLNGSRRAYLCGRIPLPDVENNTELVSRNNLAGLGAVNLIGRELELNKQYTLFIKGDLSPGAYPIIRAGDTAAFTTYSFAGSVKRRPDKMYKVNFFITSKNYSTFLEILFGGSTGENKILWSALYDGYVSSPPTSVPENRRPTIYNSFSKSATVPASGEAVVLFTSELNAALDTQNYDYMVNATVSGPGATTVQATLVELNRAAVKLMNTTATERNITVHYFLLQIRK